MSEETVLLLLTPKWNDGRIDRDLNLKQLAFLSQQTKTKKRSDE